MDHIGKILDLTTAREAADDRRAHLRMLASLTATAELVTTRDTLLSRLDHWRQAITALDEPSCLLSPSSRALARANQTAALRQHEARLVALNDQLALAAERDGMQATRPDGCRCLGLGLVPGGDWCPCPEGVEARMVRERAAAAAEAQHVVEEREIAAARYQAETRERQDLANIPPHYREATFETFPFEPGKADVVDRMQVLAAAREPIRGAYLWGEFGVGKTGLACAALNARVLQRRPCLFVTVSAFLDWVRRTYDRQSEETTDRVMQKVSTTPCLVLDDLGAEYLTRWGRDRLFAVINHRDTHDLLTVVTSNYSPGEIAARLAGDDDIREGKRIVWRLLECCDVIELRGHNLRARHD